MKGGLDQFTLALPGRAFGDKNAIAQKSFEEFTHKGVPVHLVPMLDQEFPDDGRFGNDKEIVPQDFEMCDAAQFRCHLLGKAKLVAAKCLHF